MTDRETLKLALDALKQSQTTAPFGKGGVVYWEGVKIHEAAIAAIEQALAQPSQAHRDIILSMAREAEFNRNEIAYLGDNLARFAALVAAAERDACAEVCADLYKQWEDDFANVRVGEDDPEIPNWFDCKLAIEARSETWL